MPARALVSVFPFFLVAVAACGDGTVTRLDGGSGDGGGGSLPGCEPCAAGLVRETDPCGPALNACINNPMMSAQEQVACFQADGRCYSSALDRSSACHRACGDEEQANVESCTGGCFTDRANCAEQAILRVDSCLDGCQTQTDCDFCTARGQLELMACLDTLVDCSEECKSRFRGG